MSQAWKLIPVVLVLATGCGGSSKATSTSIPKAKTPSRLASVGRLTSCMKARRVPFSSLGETPLDPGRLHEPVMTRYPIGGAFEFAGTATLSGTFADLWVYVSIDEAKAGVDGFDNDPQPPWFVDRNRNIVMAFYKPARLKINATSDRFDRCLATA